MATPHPHFPHFFAALSNPGGPIPLVPLAGQAFRATLPKWMSEPYRNTGVGSVLAGGRWNCRNLFPAIYYSTTAATVAAEADAEAIRQGWPAGAIRPQTRAAFQINVQSLADLTDAAVRKALGISLADISNCDWQTEQAAGREALTQAVARAAFERLAEGLIVPSVRIKGGVNIVLFLQHLRPGSQVTAHHANQIPFVHGLP